ncbi:acyltransferase [Jannaschia donghaensis]|uniref:Galactoside O-acetyltransferase n=1 Tax=Jannaschia donghaensis TaxID=420998 RepID=A0A0M6YG60_9RHOB|nr:acyltransferase [Jannaschia donghaensis]CTQ49341.1 Galactoside O-acetyltransferase [Jannaschia donghaensis]
MDTVPTPMADPRSGRAARGLVAAGRLLDPRVLLHGIRMLNYYGYAHVRPRGRMTCGTGVRIAPNASFRSGERIELGDAVQLGERVSLWAGKTTARVMIGARTTLGPDVFVTAADYGLAAATRIVDQPMEERDVVIGADCWIGTKAVITAGVTLGDGCVIGAGSVVTRNVPPGAIAAGVPARVIRQRA